MKPNVVIPYSLTCGEKNSDTFHADITAFGEYLIPEMEKAFGQTAGKLAGYLKQKKTRHIASREEYLFEALMLGVFWNIYGGFAGGTKALQAGFMQKVAKNRLKGGICRKLSDVIRAFMAHGLLKKKSNERLFLFPETAGLEKLILWMRATGEFNPEAERFSVWLDFFRYEGEVYAFVDLCRIRNFAAAFIPEAERRLGRYTSGVNAFVARIEKARLFREDKISVTRKSGEYHLNMVGAFIYNRALRHEFSRCQRKLVLLPACMKAPQRGSCKAVKGSLGEVCTGCSPQCQVNQVRLLQKDYPFKVEIVRHSSDISLSKQAIPSGTGIVGVGCLPTVINGGLALMGSPVPAQCVVLDHSGCRHWCKRAASTALNLNVLSETLSGDAEPADGQSSDDHIKYSGDAA